MRGLMIAGAAGLVFVVGQAAVFWAAFRLAPASAEVEALARTYLAIRIWGAPATIAIYALTGWLIAMERTRGVLVLQLAMNGVNVVLDLWFVLGLGWGVAGRGGRDADRRVVGARCSGSGSAARPSPARSGATGRGSSTRRGCGGWRAVNGDILIRSVILQASFTSFLFLGAGLGDVTLAANQVLLQFLVDHRLRARRLRLRRRGAGRADARAARPRRRCGARRSSPRSGASAASLALALAFLLAGRR